MTERHGGIGDAAVRKATGRGWAEWFAALDQSGGRDGDHKTIVTLVQAIDSELSPWWQQSVAVAYEQARGLREVHEKPGGFEISRSRTIDAPMEALYRAWTVADERAAWLPEPITIRKATPGKSLRITWEEDRTHLNVAFYPKGPDRCQISVQHTKLKDGDQAEARKTFWSERLDRLRHHLT